MRIRALLTIAACGTSLLAAGGCGNAKNSAPKVGNALPTQNLTEAQRIAQEGKVTCENPSECSPSVAMLVAAEDQDTSTCSSFLIADDVLATNSHCIPDDLKTAGSSCANRLWAYFPSTSQFGETRIDCAEVIEASKISKKTDTANPDYAFIRLAKGANRPVLAISHAGLEEDETYTAMKVNPDFTHGLPEGVVQRASCKPIYGSVLIDTPAHPLSPVLTIGDCDIVHGNSGSPLLDGHGAVRAIVHGAMEREKVTSSLNKKGVSVLDGGQLAHLGAATNLACVQTPADPSPLRIDAFCGMDPEAQKKAGVDKQAQLQAPLEEELADAIASAGMDPDFQWTVAAAPDSFRLYTELGANERYLVSAPRCIVSARKLAAKNKSFFGSYSTDTNEKTEAVAWKIEMGVNRYLQLGYQLAQEPLARYDAKIYFDAKALHENGKSKYTFKIKNADGRIVISSGEIGDCSVMATPVASAP